MARKSRKVRNQPIVEQSVARIYKTGIYLRLSAEDNKMGTEGETIATQQSLVERFVEQQMDMTVVSIYTDNGFTGTNFQRPSFETMIDDIRKRVIDCIIVKDLSRFGREYVETGYYLERIFPYLDVRFIAILDNYDTLKNPDSSALMVSMKNIVNSYIPKDISKKISTSHKQRQERGDLVCSYFPYGYMIDPDDKRKLAIDPMTAPVVSDIFQWYASGDSQTEIARRLNDNDIPSPASYKKELFRNKMKDNPLVWSGDIIRYILKNYTYTGNLTQRKTVTSLADGHGKIRINPDDYLVAYGSHPAIVTEELFQEVKQRSEKIRDYHKKNHGKVATPENIFKGILFCSDCGRNLHMKKHISGKSGVLKMNYHCRYYSPHNINNICSRKNLREGDLREAILLGVKQQIQLSFSFEEALNTVKESEKYITGKKSKEKSISEIEKSLNRNLSLTSSLFEHFADNIIDKSEYTRLQGKYSKERECLEEQLKLMKEKLSDDESLLSMENEWSEQFRSYSDISDLTEEMLKHLVKKIVVSNYNDVEIHWNFHQEYLKVIDFVEEYL